MVKNPTSRALNNSEFYDRKIAEMRANVCSTASCGSLSACKKRQPPTQTGAVEEAIVAACMTRRDLFVFDRGEETGFLERFGGCSS
jgi:hypothetical protein